MNRDLAQIAAAATAHMNEAEYYESLGAVSSVMANAAEEFRAIAAQAVYQIIAAREAYQATAEDADAVLYAMDKAANCRQSVRYSRKNRDYKLVVTDPDGAGNNIIAAAWKVAEEAKAGKPGVI